MARTQHLRQRRLKQTTPYVVTWIGNDHKTRWFLDKQGGSTTSIQQARKWRKKSDAQKAARTITRDYIDVINVSEFPLESDTWH